VKQRILFAVFLFSFIFNVVFIFHLLSVRHSEEGSLGKKFTLNDLQKEKITEESGVILSENLKFEIELKKCRQDLYNLLNSKVPDKKEIEKCITTINDIQKNIQMNTVEQLLIYKKHMTEDQCKCFLKEFGQKMNVHHVCDENCNCNK